MFYLYQHEYGRKLITRNGPAQGLLEWPKHEWTWTQGYRSKAKAIAAARAHPIHARISIGHTADFIFDNGKEPGLPEGWWPATAQTCLEPRPASVTACEHVGEG
jgi:hypothetical protein